MRKLITEAFLGKLEPREQDIWDTRCRGLVLRCRASGKHAWRFQAKRGLWLKIGRLDDFKPDQARGEADKLRGDVARGKDPRAEKRALEHGSSLGRFIETEYTPWVLANRKTGAETLERLQAAFGDLMAMPLAGVSLARVERWRTARLAADVTPSTTNRDIAALRSVLTRAIEFGFLTTHPLALFKAAKVDAKATVRYLTADEEKRLRKALKARDAKRRKARASANRWRRARGYPTLPPFDVYSDHTTPLILLALGTGLRRGELLGLQWADVNLERAMLTVHGGDAKSGETRHVPLHAELVTMLKAWRGAGDRAGYVFPGAEGAKLDGTKTAWASIAKAAKLTAFRFHDLRHTFASKLVQRGVDLNVTRELLGHHDLKMTLRYSHLRPADTAAAVAKLVGR